MAKKLVKKQDGGSSRGTTNKINRVEKRIDKTLARVDSSFAKADENVGTRKGTKFENKGYAQMAKASRLNKKSYDLRDKRGDSSTKPEPPMKKGGSVKKK